MSCQAERALLTQFGCGRDDLGVARTAGPSPPPTAGAPRPAAPAIRPPRPASCRARIAAIAMASRPRDGPAKCAPVVATTPDPEPRRQRGQRGIAFVVERVAVMGELDTDPVGAEPVHQIGQRRRRGLRSTLRKGLPHMAFAASGENVPVPTRGLGQRVEVVPRLALLAAGQVRRRQLTRTAGGSPPGRGPAPAGAVRADRDRSVRAPSPSDSSAPNTVRMSSSRAASANRTTP